MKFKALQAGFHGGNRIRVGTVFDAPSTFKATWAVGVDTPAAKDTRKDTAAKAAKAAPVTLSELAKEPAVDGTADLS